MTCSLASSLAREPLMLFSSYDKFRRGIKAAEVVLCLCRIREDIRQSPEGDGLMSLYTDACTVVRTDAGLSVSFDVKGGLHQGSVLSPLLLTWRLSPVRRKVVYLQRCCMLIT